MGTNYYAQEKSCPHCGRGGDRLHIGKSSIGWAFILRTHADRGIENLTDWIAYLADKEIVDEYGHEHSLGELVETIAQCHYPQLRRSRDMWTTQGKGTWEYYSREFS